VRKVRKTLGFIISSFFCAILVYVFLIAVFPPRIFLSPYYILAVYFITGLFLLTFDFVLSRQIQKINRNRFFQSIQQWSNRKKVIWSVLLITIIVALSSVRPVLDNINDKRILQDAKQQFLPITYSVISEAKVDRTLVELQRTLKKLRTEYIEKSPDYIIKVHLFSNRNEFIEKTGMSELSVGGTLTLAGRPPEIIIPVEQESSIWNNTLPTSTPSHEITHVVTFEALQLKDIILVPRFYIEGMAEYESLKDFRRFPDRLFKRIRLAFYKNQLIRLEAIPTLDIKDRNVNDEDILLFYRLSEEFIRYLIHSYGEHKPWHVVRDVGQGMNFYDAFKREYNKEYSVTFSEFLGYFY